MPVTNALQNRAQMPGIADALAQYTQPARQSIADALARYTPQPIQQAATAAQRSIAEALESPTGQKIAQGMATIDPIGITDLVGPMAVAGVASRGLKNKVLSVGSDAYRGVHKAPKRGDYGAPLHDLTQIYPDDIYSNEGIRYYGTASPYDHESYNVIRAARGRPDATVTVYRAVPSDKGDDINPGDWVTTSRSYAKQHGEAALSGDYKILSKKVKASDLFTEANSIHEWGWSPTD